MIVLLFKAIHRHYTDGGRRARGSRPAYRPRRMNHTVVVLVGGVHRGVLEALAYARSLNPNHLVAVTVVSDEEEQERIERQWEEFGIDVPLEIVYSPYRELTRPVLRFIDELDARYDNDVITVLLPEFVVRPLVGQPPPQPERAAPEGAAAVPEGHGRDLRPVPPRVTGPTRRQSTATGQPIGLRVAPCDRTP